MKKRKRCGTEKNKKENEGDKEEEKKIWRKAMQRDKMRNERTEGK